MELLRGTHKLQGDSWSLRLTGLWCRRDQGELQDDPKEVHRRLHLHKGWNPEWNLAWLERVRGNHQRISGELPDISTFARIQPWIVRIRRGLKKIWEGFVTSTLVRTPA